VEQPQPELELLPTTAEEPPEEASAELEEDAEPSPHIPPAQLLTELCQERLRSMGMPECVDKVHVFWNTRMRSTAGYAHYPSWKIDLNPRIAAFDGQVERTLLHELAHLVAYYRAGRRRIEPHGPEWRQACADLGIPDESPTHRMPLPRKQQQRRISYQCPVCLTVVHRVRPFTRATACIHCCRKYSGGRYDARFRFQQVLVVSGTSA
jgi:SprT protein